MYRELPASPWLGARSPSPAFQRWLRRGVALFLRRAGLRLAQAARKLDSNPRHPPGLPPPDDLPLLEFHADAGAPEGALYVQGRYVGRLEVDRL